MFFVFGFGKQTVKDYGATPEQYCGHCHNQSPRRLAKATTWFTLFFIPVIPYRTRYMLLCPICGNAQELPKEEFEEIIRSLGIEEKAGAGAGAGPGPGPQGFSPSTRPQQPPFLSDEAKYAGKTPTQIAYLKKLESHERALAARQENEEEEE